METANSFLSTTQCNNVKALGSSLGPDTPVTTSMVKKDGTHMQSSDRKSSIMLFPGTSEDLSFVKDKIESTFTIEEGSVCEYFQISKYDSDDFFLPHTDEYYESEESTKVRTDTFIIQLSASNAYTGGDLTVGGNTVSRARGSCVRFTPDTVHGVDKITNGERWSLVVWYSK